MKKYNPISATRLLSCFFCWTQPLTQSVY